MREFAKCTHKTVRNSWPKCTFYKVHHPYVVLYVVFGWGLVLLSIFIFAIYMRTFYEVVKLQAFAHPNGNPFALVPWCMLLCRLYWWFEDCATRKMGVGKGDWIANLHQTQSMGHFRIWIIWYFILPPGAHQRQTSYFSVHVHPSKILVCFMSGTFYV